ncbi:MAG: DUF134 domain-containing protein [Candidatus Bipolaricaulota bacterium]
MPRPPKPRWYQIPPPHDAYKPAGVPMAQLERVELRLDELETLRLCDGEGLDQQQAGREMGVSRGTVQRLLTSGRCKVANALADGKALVISCPGYVQLRRGHGPRHRGGRPAG